jgi:RND family efflux transporter MFP subunit
MKKPLIALVVAVLGATGFCYYRGAGSGPAASSSGGPGGGPGGGAGGGGGRPGGGGPGGAAFGARPPMTVELSSTARTAMAETISVVGSLEGQASVEVASKVSGRLQEVNVRIGDRVSRGQRLALVEDRELREQVRQAEASFDVARATIRQREADLKFAETNLERSRSLFQRQLLPRQTMDDADARQQSAVAQLDLARAQFEQAKARLDELKITLSNAEIASPVNGFVGRRLLDPGAFVSSNTPVVSVVEIDRVRLVANLVEKDLRRVQVGTLADVEVDAFPGDVFKGRVARVAPVLDPSTRTAQLEIEVPNPDFRLKPGMYSRVRLTVATKTGALTVPVNAVVDIDGRRGVFTVADGQRRLARFHPVQVGIEDGTRAEILGGIEEGTRIITTGAAGLRDGDPVMVAGPAGPPGGGRARNSGAGAPASEPPRESAPATRPRT